MRCLPLSIIGCGRNRLGFKGSHSFTGDPPSSQSGPVGASAWKCLLVSRVKVEVLHPSSSDGFRMTDKVRAGERAKGARGISLCAGQPLHRSERGRKNRPPSFEMTYVGASGSVGAKAVCAHTIRYGLYQDIRYT